MGKRDFRRIYKQIKSDHGTITGKISYFSHKFQHGHNYAGIIVYGIKGQTNWRNTDGEASGYNGRSFYLIIQDTATFPQQRDVGQGRVHHYPLENVLGYSIDKDEVLCGGFAYHEGKLKFSSIWLNENDQTGLYGASGEHDGSKYLSVGEQVLVRHCWEEYKTEGPNAVFDIPSDVENRILSS